MNSKSPPRSSRIFTIGHSNRPLSEFLRILASKKLKLVVDVRTIPRSRHNPQYDQKKFIESLRKNRIEYRHFAGLGGLRRPKKDSQNKGWRNAAFRGFADYMQTPEFAKSLTRLVNAAKRKRLAVICAEAVPWRCHRFLIADAIVARGLPVEHLISPSSTRSHMLTKFARMKGNNVTYPG